MPEKIIEWTNVRIPTNSEVNKEILKGGRVAAWKILEEIVISKPKTKQDKAIKLYDQFVEDISEIYPGHERQLNYLRSLIFNKILRIPNSDGSNWVEPNDNYYNYLKKL